jgi:catechol 2,3-dioxygenase-like lactoylglutathione lyase family enzyme
MANTGGLSHIDISVGYPDRSIPFYDAFFRALGYRRWTFEGAGWSEWQGDAPSRATWSIRCGDGSTFGVEVRPSRPESRDQAYDRYAPGPHHLAFHADSPETVDRVHAALVEAGATVLDAPADYGGQRGYGEGYYAAFYADPDGLKLEVVSFPPSNP